MKKIVCLFLCLVLLVPAAASLAASAPEISNIAFTITPPEAGTYVSRKSAKDSIAVSGEEYALETAKWAKKENNEFIPLEDNDRFTKDNTYIFVCFETKQGYYFADNPVFSVAGGTLVTAEGYPQFSSHKAMGFFKVTPTGEDLPAVTKISQIDLSIASPVAGTATSASTPAITIPAGAHYSLVANTWKWKKANDVFRLEEIFTATGTIQAAEGYEFDEHCYLNPDGYNTDIQRNLDTTGRYYNSITVEVGVRVTTPARSIDQVSLTVIQPEAGTKADTPPKVTVPSGSLYCYDPDYSAWYTSDFSQPLDENEVFEAGNTYYALLFFKANDEYDAFAEKPQISITNAQLVDEEIIAGLFNMVLPVKFTIPRLCKVTVTTDGNGTASASAGSGMTGTEVSLTATPNEGYNFKGWQVIAGGVSVKDNKFTIGVADVEIKAVFEKSGETQPQPAPGPDPAPGSDPGTTPGSDPGTAPGSDPGSAPDSEPGIEEQVTLKKIKISKVTASSKKKIKVQWKKLSKKVRKQAKMIEVQVSPDKSFQTDVITKKLKSSKTSVSVSGLKKNTKYYVRIRVYTEDGNIRYVSPWSSVKKVKTKKK